MDFVTGATQAQVSLRYRPEMEEPMFEMRVMQPLYMITGAHTESWSFKPKV